MPGFGVENTDLNASRLCQLILKYLDQCLEVRFKWMKNVNLKTVIPKMNRNDDESDEN